LVREWEQGWMTREHGSGSMATQQKEEALAVPLRGEGRGGASSSSSPSENVHRIASDREEQELCNALDRTADSRSDEDPVVAQKTIFDAPPLIPQNRLPSVPGYHHSKKLSSQQCKAASSVLWEHMPGPAASITPVPSWQHQALSNKATPHPYKGAMMRWPDVGHAVGGPAHCMDGRRRHYDFSVPQGRNSSMWLPGGAEDNGAAFSLTLADIKIAVTKKFGSLLVAFNHMDIFQDGQLSAIEWQEGVRGILNSFRGEEGVRYRSFLEPKSVFNNRMRDLFKSMDVNDDGVIDFEEFAVPVAEVEHPHLFTERQHHERASAALATSTLTFSRAPLRDSLSYDSLTAMNISPRGRNSVASDDDEDSQLRAQAAAARKAAAQGGGKAETEDIRVFSTMMMRKYNTIEAAFAAIDVNSNGELSMAEFSEGAKMRVRFHGNLKRIFEHLDTDRNGTIGLKEFKTLRGLKASEEEIARHRLVSRKELFQNRCGRSEKIEKPQAHARGGCLVSCSHYPLGEKVSSSSGYYSFGRCPTGRLDKCIHPNDLPGSDISNFTDERGPGYLPQGPENFSCCGDSAHPLRGTSWRNGAVVNRSERFGPLIPSHAGKVDGPLSASRFLNHTGGALAEKAYRGTSNLGAVTVAAKGNRFGPTIGATDSALLAAPEPIGMWKHTKASLKCKSSSAPSLLKLACH